MSMGNGLRNVAAALSLASLAVAGPAAAQEVKIGAVLGLTGGLAAYAPAIVDAAQLAVKHVNDNGGVLDGRQLRLMVVDDQTNPQVSVDAARRLVSAEGVVAIIGPLGSGQVLAVAPSVTIPNGVPHLAPTATSPKLTTLDDKDFVFRTVASDAFAGVVLADVVQKRGLKTVALMFQNNDYGVGLADSFRTAFKKKGGTITSDAAFEPKKPSYRSELATAGRGNPEALVLIAYPADGGNTILRQSLEGGFFKRFVLTDGMRDQSVLNEIGAKNLEGSFGVAPEAAGDTEALKRFQEAFKEASQRPVDSLFIRETYDALMLAALAIEKAGSTDRAKIRDALRPMATPPGETVLPNEWKKAKQLIREGKDVDYIGAAGPHNFDEAGDVAGSIGHFEVKGNRFETVEVIAP
jgi:branched-chain amino acid transport system substrate-binding protein